MNHWRGAFALVLLCLPAIAASPAAAKPAAAKKVAPKKKDAAKNNADKEDAEQRDDSGGGLLGLNPHGGFLQVGIGPSLGLTGCRPADVVDNAEDAGCSSENAFSQLMLTQDFGWHFSNDAEGFALGINVEESFFSDIVRIAPGAKVWLDFLVREEWGLYMGPTLKVGYAAYTNTTELQQFFNAQVGLAGKFSLDERWLIFLQPVTIDFIANGDGTAFAYNALFGAGVAL